MEEVPVVSPLRQRVAEPARGVVHHWKPEPLGITVRDTETRLSLTLEINVVKSARARCPSCAQRRVLFHLAAWSKGSPAGAGTGLCAGCAGFREPDVARNARRTR